MTHKYILRSSIFEGELELEFDLKGLLKSFKNNAELNNEQLKWLGKNFPTHVEAAKELVSKSQSLKATYLPPVLDFDIFWDAYNHKALSNKVLSRKIWSKLSDAERLMVLEDIKPYDNRLKLQPGVAKKYAETYLRSEVWRK